MTPFLLIESKMVAPLVAPQDVGRIVWDADPAAHKTARLLVDLSNGQFVAGTCAPVERAGLIAPHTTMCGEAIHAWLTPRIEELLP